MSTPDSSSAEWYYSDEGRQSGPVSLSELQERARSGRLNPARDLVWNSSMTEWVPAGRLPELFPPTPGGVGANPYAPPVSVVLQASPPEGMLPEIPPGSQPADAIECLKRAFTLVNRELVPLALVALVCGVLTAILVYILAFAVVGMPAPGYTPSTVRLLLFSVLINAAGGFFALGFIRVALNVVSGREFSVNLLFSEGGRYLPALWPIVGVGVLVTLFSSVGILGSLVGNALYVFAWIRFGLYMALVVDRNMETMDALKQSFRLTENSGLPLFVLNLLLGVVFFIGAIPCGLGLLYAMPVLFVAQAVVYRCLQYGRVALADDPATSAPVLKGRIPE